MDETERLAEINRMLEQFIDEIGMGTILAMVVTILCDQEASRD